MKEGYVIRDQDRPHFLTCTIIEWIDIFTRKTYRDSIIECLEFCIKNKGMILYGYVIMSNHLHFIVQSRDGKLSDLIRDFKKFTAKQILDKMQTEPESRKDWILERLAKATETHSRNKNFQVWQYGNHAEEIFSLKFLWDKLNYIHLNPVRAGIVSKANHYVYSSATNYSNGTGIINSIEIAENPVINVNRSSEFWKYNNYNDE
ncbi:Transposase and inactivated derivatives [Chryseobacterium gleum]|uniref:Transposase and inactivated derivatives n=1 Tax=Chryseobacterium gleum TaxID=250 RepID=A0A3S4R102_CHRGE|nr:transposase [Chryseobacterium gleum]QQY34547.1 transposase [Chryseobacterium gleum]VEE06333.1 Transposase and inactivated derivatives [Chryseobacterium gleum]